MLPSSHKVLLGTLTGLTKRLSDQGSQQRMSRKAESRKWDSFDLGFGRMHRMQPCHEKQKCCLSLLKLRDHLAITQPESCNMLVVLLLCQPLLNCSSSFIFLCYDQNSVSRRDVMNLTGISKNHQNKYQYMELAISDT